MNGICLRSKRSGPLKQAENSRRIVVCPTAYSVVMGKDCFNFKHGVVLLSWKFYIKMIFAFYLHYRAFYSGFGQIILNKGCPVAGGRNKFLEFCRDYIHILEFSAVMGGA